jgi:N-glycosylase/DNA lyase
VRRLGGLASHLRAKHSLYNYLDTFRTETDAREAITQLFPGVGLKQASMFLRDIGYADRLCIIDTHLLWYCGQMGKGCQGTLTPKKYIEVENYLLGQSDELGVSPKILDSAIWVAVTTFKAQQCTMQFA